MQFEQAGKHRPEILDKVQEHKPLEFVKHLLKNIDHLLGIVGEQKPESLTSYVANLETRYQQLVKTDYLSSKSIDVSPFLTELAHLSKFPRLVGMLLNYHFQLLQLPRENKGENEVIEITHRVFLRSALIPQYINLQVLTETVARYEAIQIYKHHVTLYVRKRIADQEDQHQTLEELREDSLKTDPENPIWLRMVGEVEDGKLIIRKDCCYWADALEDLSDSELKYLVCCYGDFESVKTYNKRFKLTMEHTIAAGDSYCDCVYYDTRVTKDFTHPSKEFFDSI
ncbi:MAG: L-2-amino-thiazoline-4-carboxylic acid hydrolase [Candidatus Hermodarchaeota archaeon]|nr:L-2-amino-thiazoline-4-carboxylic acid hydrolase [Candidatus Hermodarchaeota archaeon]